MSPRPPVAIVGMAVLLPGAPDMATYWANLRDGVDAITTVPVGRHDPAAGDGAWRGGFVDPVLPMDLRRFGIMPGSVAGMEPDQLIALHVAAAAVADAGGVAALGAPERIGVVLGRGGYLTPATARFEQRVRGVPQVLRTVRALVPDLDEATVRGIGTALLAEAGEPEAGGAIGLVPNLAASRIANRLDLRGPAYTVDAACASSLIAVDHAVSALAGGRCDAVLAGGVHHCHDETLWATFAQLGALSASRRSAPLSASADGLLIGEGTGVVVLKRLADAVRDGDRVYAVITGVGTASDGRTGSLFAPDTGGQAAAVRAAWDEAGIDPRDGTALGLLEAHGTATRAGDDTELATLAAVFGTGPATAVIGSVKSMIGHAMPAAGVASLVKAALALHHATLLPTLHCAEPNPLLSATRFRTLAAAEPWPSQQGARRAGVNAFGFGGINAHVVLEEAHHAGRPTVSISEPERMLRLAVDSPAALAAALDRPDTEVRELPPGAGRRRLGAADPTEQRLRAARAIVARGGAWRGRNDVWFTAEPLLPGGKIAFCFPGLEAEAAGDHTDVATRLGLPAPRPGEGTDLETRGQVLMDTGRLLATALDRLHLRPDAVCGHSVGEWTAMAVGGMFGDDPRAVDELRRRHLPGGVAVPDVDFATLGCDIDTARHRLAGHPELAVSHDNSARQSVVCGPPEQLAAFAAACRADGIVARVLPFRSGFHTPMFGAFRGPFERLAAELPMHASAVPVWSATTVAPFPADPDRARALYLRHLVEPVRFRELVEALHVGGHSVFVVPGGGQLGSFVADTLGERAHLVVHAGSRHRSGLAQLRRVALACWVDGHPYHVSALDGPPAPAGVLLQLGVAPLELDAGTAAALRPRGVRQAPVPDLPPALADGLAALLADTERAATEIAAAARSTPATGIAVPVRVSLADQPSLRGHCLHRQRPDWPDVADLRAVLPATTILDLVATEVARAYPGEPVTGFRDARFDAWVLAEPAQTVTVRMRRTAAGIDAALVAADGGSLASVTVLRGTHRPIARVPVADPPPVRRTADDVYGQRQMFHEPPFQGIVAVTGIGPDAVTGEIVTPDAPGGLLDNVGQLAGVWLLEHHDDGLFAFPRRIDAIDLAGPLAAPGTRLTCVLRAATPDPAALTFDAQLLDGDRVAVDVRGWRDVRLDGGRRAFRANAWPDTAHLGERRAGGWVLVEERWTSLAARTMIAGSYLGADERDRLAALPPTRRRSWLLGRIAAKDAVRDLLGEPVYPAELEIGNDEQGRPTVAGKHGRALPPITVSIAHSGRLGVAHAGPAGSRPGIDVEEIRDRPPSTFAAALTEGELTLLAGRGGPAEWFTRFWTAKEAAAKARGSGLGGAPRTFEAIAIAKGGAIVRDPDGALHTVIHHRITAMGGTYVVAVTGGASEEEQT